MNEWRVFYLLEYLSCEGSFFLEGKTIATGGEEIESTASLEEGKGGVLQ